MKLKISKEGVFTPKFNDNTKLSSTDQITVRYKAPTVAIKNRCRQKPQGKAISNADGKVEHMEIVIDKDEISTLREMLVSISNCSYEDDEGKSHSIASTQDLINAPIEFEPLLKEIVAEFDRLLDHTEINEKN